MECINDISNPLYKNAQKRTMNIDIKIKKTKINSLHNNCFIGGPKSDILMFLKGGPSKNLINSFFKYKTNNCDYCGIEKNKSIQLDRAHCNKNNCDRTSLLEKSINKYFVDENTPIKIRDILITFIKYHEQIPLFILCKKCHRNYDS